MQGTGPIWGALIAGVFGLLGLWVGSRRERVKWTREARHTAYRDFLGAIDALMIESAFARTIAQGDNTVLAERILGAEMSRLMQTVAAKRADVVILGPDIIVQLADKLTSETLDQFKAETTKSFMLAREEFVKGATGELKLASINYFKRGKGTYVGISPTESSQDHSSPDSVAPVEGVNRDQSV